MSTLSSLLLHLEDLLVHTGGWNFRHGQSVLVLVVVFVAAVVAVFVVNPSVEISFLLFCALAVIAATAAAAVSNGRCGRDILAYFFSKTHTHTHTYHHHSAPHDTDEPNNRTMAKRIYPKHW